MRVISIVIPFVLVCVLSSGITAVVMTQADEPVVKKETDLLSAPPGFVAKRTAHGGGIYYERQDIATLPTQPGQAAFPKALTLSEQAKCRIALAQDRSSHDPDKVKVTDEYCRQLLEKTREKNRQDS